MVVRLFIALVLLWASPSLAGSRTGTPTQIDASAGNISTSVTVPVDATGVVAFWSHWDGDAGSTLSCTLAGVALPIHSQIAEGATAGEAGVGVGALANPATGSQTFACTWSAGGARTEGGEIVLLWVKDVNTADLVRAAVTDAGTGSGNVEGALATETTDLLLAFAMSSDPTNPGLAGTPFIDNAIVNGHRYDLSEVIASATSTTVTMTDESFSTMAVIALKDISSSAMGCRLLQDGTSKRLLQNGTDGRVLQAGGTCNLGGGGPSVVPVRMMLGNGL